MSGRYLLDTNIIIQLFKGDQTAVNHLTKADEVYVSSITIGELAYGARNSTRVKENLERVQNLVETSTILHCDENTAFYYSEVKFELKQLGNPIPENDVWIAAIALEHNLILVTRDAHFAKISDLTAVKWD